MASIPSLQSGSTVQYPLTTTRTYSTKVIQFIDGTEQRFAQTSKGRTRWTVSLRDLTASEVEDWGLFAAQSTVANQEFVFQDPVTGETHTKCRLSADPISIEHLDEQRAQLSLTVIEVE